MRTATCLLICLALSLLTPAGASEEKAPFQVIVNQGNALDRISPSDLAALFLKKRTAWSGGSRVLVVQPLRGSPTRKAFEERILQKSPGALEAYWRQLIFSGRDVPPLEKSPDAAIVDFVRDNPGAVGIVSSDALTGGVRPVALGEAGS